MRRRGALVWAALFVAIGCVTLPPVTAQAPPKLPKKLDDPAGLHNLIEVTPRIYSGSEPSGDEAFANLQRLGVKTIVSVDGARPDTAAAAKHGIRYVHIPIGYDGVDNEAGRALANVVRQSGEPIYVHCHHGKHRGPAAAAVACMAADHRSGDEALKILELAGTGTQYAGLWRDVKNYVPPGPDEKLPQLAEVAQIGSFAAAMAKLDRNFDNLKLCAAAGWSTPNDHPDLVPAQEALILRESLHEVGRLAATKAEEPTRKRFSEDFKTRLSGSEAFAQLLEDALRANDVASANKQFDNLDKSCKQCHAQYRD